LVEPLDGISLLPLIRGEMSQRPEPIPFYQGDQMAWMGPRYKLIGREGEDEEWELYDLVEDPGETTDLAAQQPGRTDRMRKQLLGWKASVERSQQGADY
jgi:arylsulfatase A-like enzyme